MDNQVLPIHFGNLDGRHEINSDSLLVFIDSYKEISEAFGFSVDIQIGIPEEGGWKAVLILAITSIGASPFITLLTGETADDWAKKSRSEIVLVVNNFITKKLQISPRSFLKNVSSRKIRFMSNFRNMY